MNANNLSYNRRRLLSLESSFTSSLSLTTSSKKKRPRGRFGGKVVVLPPSRAFAGWFFGGGGGGGGGRRRRRSDDDDDDEKSSTINRRSNTNNNNNKSNNNFSERKKKTTRIFAGSGRTTISKNTRGRQYPFPADYDVMVQQARQALQKAREDGVDLGEIQFPPGGLDLAPGDLEGNVECTLTATVLRKILRGMKEEEKITVLFPDPTELKLAKRGQTGMCAPDGVAPPEVFQTDPLFEDWRGELNYLDDPNAFSVSGLDKIFGKSATVNDRVDINEGNMFVCAYPSGNIAELTQTRLLYENIREENESKKSKESDAPASKTKTKKKSLVVVNGELDRTRSNYYPWFWNKNEMEPLREFSQSFEGIYFIHNFKGTNPAVLFRCYPDDWRVFRRRPNDAVECVWSSSTRPKSLKEIALDVLPKFP